MKAVDEWPKKLSAGKYAKRWYADRCKQSIVNDLKAGKLPGSQDVSGHWFVWVNSDLSAAWGYQGPENEPASGSATGNAIADNILNKFRKTG